MVFLRILVIGTLLLSATLPRSTVPEPTPSLALSNTIAIAVPLTDIADRWRLGELAQRPADLQATRTRLRIEFDRRKCALLDTSANCNPHFRVGYNLQDQSISVAIETRDDTLFEEDASLVYLYTALNPSQEPVRYYHEYHSENPEVSKIGFFQVFVLLAAKRPSLSYDFIFNTISVTSSS